MDMVSAKFVFALAAIWAVPAHHFDVPSAYVKAEVEDDYDIFLFPPQGMKFSPEELSALGVSRKEDLALRLNRSLYGLKQAGRLWHEHLKSVLLNIGFIQALTDSCIFYKNTSAGIAVVGVYVDDLFVTATDVKLIEKFHADMSELDLKNLGPATKFLGMNIEYDGTHGYTLNQASTIAELLAKNRLDKANSVRAPIGTEDASEEDETALLPATGAGTVEHPTVKWFQSLVGSLLWLARCTRPDIHAPTLADHKLARRTLRYLIGTMNYKLHMRPQLHTNGQIRIESMTDADFASDKLDRKSVSGVMVRVNGMLVAWQAKKQGAVALSTAEAEFVAAAGGAKEILGLRQLCLEVGLNVVTPMSMHIDNQAAIKQVESEASS